MSDVDEYARNRLRDRPQLTPVLRAMIVFPDRSQSDQKADLGELCREWIASYEASTSRTLSTFLIGGLIEAAPRGRGNHRRFHVLNDPRACERQGVGQSHSAG